MEERRGFIIMRGLQLDQFIVLSATKDIAGMARIEKPNAAQSTHGIKHGREVSE